MTQLGQVLKQAYHKKCHFFEYIEKAKRELSTGNLWITPVFCG